MEYDRNAFQSRLEYLRNLRQHESEMERSFSDELNKVRVQKISEVWDAMYEFESTVMRLSYNLNQFAKDKNFKLDETDEKGQKIYEIQKLRDFYEIKYRSAASTYDTVLSKNRFWLDKELEMRLLKYSVLLSVYYDAIAEDKSEAYIQKILALSRKLRLNIDEFREQILQSERNRQKSVNKH